MRIARKRDWVLWPGWIIAVPASWVRKQRMSRATKMEASRTARRRQIWGRGRMKKWIMRGESHVGEGVDPQGRQQDEHLRRQGERVGLLVPGPGGAQRERDELPQTPMIRTQLSRTLWCTMAWMMCVRVLRPKRTEKRTATAKEG
jgi:hypothetical protein